MMRRFPSILLTLAVLLVSICLAVCSPPPSTEEAAPASESEKISADGFESGEPGSMVESQEEEDEEEEE